MRTISRKTIRHYHKEKYAFPLLIGSEVLLLTGGLIAGLWMLPSGTAFFCFVASISIGLIMFGQWAQWMGRSDGDENLPWTYRLYQRRQSALYPQPETDFWMIDTWNRCSGRFLSEIPRSQIGSKLYEAWAKEHLAFLAGDLNEAYENQKEFFDEAQSIDWPNLIPRSGEKLLKRREKRERIIAKDVKRKKAEFLNFWDLVTGKGLRILIGSNWIDPEKFRASIRNKDMFASIK